LTFRFVSFIFNLPIVSCKHNSSIWTLRCNVPFALHLKHLVSLSGVGWDSYLPFPSVWDSVLALGGSAFA
jgi:hypothetical protein